MIKIEKIHISNGLKNVAKLSSGTIIGQLISIATLPVITRIYGPETMGIWANILAISLILQTICDLGLSSSIMLEETHEGVINSYTIITSISLLICIAAFFLLTSYYLIAKSLDIKIAIFYSMLTVIYSFTTKQVLNCYNWLTRNKMYSVLMKNPIINYLSVAIFAIGFYFLNIGSLGYFLAVILGQIFTLINMKRYLPRKMFNFKFKQYISFVKKYSEFVRFQMPNNISLQLREQLPNILIATFWGDKILGYYSVTSKILSMPVTFIGQAIGKVFFQTISEMKRNGQEIANFVNKNFGRVINIAFIPILGLFMFGDVVAVIFFGDDYIMSGALLRIVVFKTFFTFISACIAGLEIVLNKQKYSLLTTICQTLLASLGIMIGYYFGDIYIAVMTMVIMYIMVQLIYYTKLFKVMDISIRRNCNKMLLYFITIVTISFCARFCFAGFIKSFGLM